MIDLEEEYRAFENTWTLLGASFKNFKRGSNNMYHLDGDIPELTDGEKILTLSCINTALAMWLIQARDKQAEIDSLKAQQKLDKSARVGGTVFREGVAWNTVIECAQRHYDYGQRNTQPTPLISPSDAIKLASGELVLVPKEPTLKMLKVADKHVMDCNATPESAYKAMIEAAQENSHE